MTRQLRTLDDRGVSIQLSHVFGLAITSVLLVVVLTSAGGFVKSEQRDVARTELQTIANELATDVQHVDRLGRQGGNVSFRTSLPATVSGMDYHVSLEHGADCQTQNTQTENCLVLETTEGDVSTLVPVANRTNVAFESEGGGTFLLTSSGGDATATLDGHELAADRTLRVGVGSDFDVPRYGSIAAPINTPPIAEFTSSPDKPIAEEEIAFNATGSFDNDGDVVNYTWKFSDSSDDVYGENVSRAFDPGVHTVNLTVEDDRNATATLIREIRVSGLALDSNVLPGQLAHADEYGAVNFTVSNEWSEEVELTQIVVDPSDSDIGGLRYEWCSDTDDWRCDDWGEELYIDVENDGDDIESIDLAANRGLGSGQDPARIRDPGLVFNLPEDERIEIPDGETAALSIGEFNDSTGDVVDMQGEEMRIGLRYEIDGHTYVSTFNETVDDP